MPSLYYYFYINILYIKEFNSIIINNINEKNFSININRFKMMKNVIFIDFINKRTIKIAFNRMIIISFVILKLKIIMKCEEIEFFSLLRRFKISIILKRDKRFLKKTKETRKVNEKS